MWTSNGGWGGSQCQASRPLGTRKSLESSWSTPVALATALPLALPRQDFLEPVSPQGQKWQNLSSTRSALPTPGFYLCILIQVQGATFHTRGRILLPGEETNGKSSMWGLTLLWMWEP